MKIKGNIIFTLALLGITLFFVLGSFGYDPLARQLPLLVGIPVGVLLVLQILMQLFPKSFSWLERMDSRQVIQVDQSLAAQAKAVRAVREEKGRELEYYVWTGLFLLAIYLVGFLTAVPLFLVGLLYLRLKEKLWVSLVVAAVMWVVGYIGFIKLMEVPLFKGILWD